MEWLREVYVLLETAGALVEGVEEGLAAAPAAERVVAIVEEKGD